MHVCASAREVIIVHQPVHRGHPQPQWTYRQQPGGNEARVEVTDEENEADERRKVYFKDTVKCTERN